MKPKTTLRHFLLLAGSSLLAISSASANQTWDGGGANDFWNTAANWGGDAVPTWGSAINFSGNVRNSAVNNLTADTVIGGINFTNNGTGTNTNAFNLSGNQITLGGNISTSFIGSGGGSITDTISLNMILSGTRTVTMSSNAEGDHNLIISGDILHNGLAGFRGLNKAGLGTLTLTGNNTFNGSLQIDAGSVNFDTITNSGVASNVGAGGNLLSNHNSAATTAFFNYTGSGSTTDRQAVIGGTGPALATENMAWRIKSNGSGALVFTNANFNIQRTGITAVTSRTFFFGGANTLANQIQGVIRDNGAPAGGGSNVINVTKEDAGTWILQGNNTYTGTTTVNGGILQLDKTGSGNTAAIASTSALTLGGGEFNIKGKTTGTTTQTLGALTLSANSNSKISVNKNGGTSTTLTLGDAWTRNAGSSLVIDYSSSATGNVVNTVNATTGYALTNSIYGAILVKDTTGIGFATRAAGSNQTITRYNSATTLATNSNSSATNYTATSGSLAWSSGITNRSVNSLTIDTATNGGTIDMGASSNVLTLTSGAILFKGTNNSILTGGQVGASGSEVIVHQTSSTNTLTINSLISGGAGSLTKSGAGTLLIGGANTYTGATAINEGKLTLSGTGTLGSGGTYAGAISLGYGATLQKDSSGTQTLSGNITGLGSVVMNASGAKLTLSGASNSYTGATLVSAGTLFVTGSLTSDVTVSNAATVGGGGTVGNINLAGGALLDIFLAIDSANSLVATTISFDSAGFGIDNLVANGAAVDWTSVADGTYTLIDGALDITNLDNFGLANAYDLGGGRSAYFLEGSLQLVVVPEPGAASLIGAFGAILLLRRRRS